MLVDTHCHLVAEAFDQDRDAVIDRAVQSGVAGIVCVGDQIASSTAAAQLANRRSEVWATAGIHPHQAGEAPADLESALAPLLDDSRVVAVGEVGLDYHYDFAPRDVQQAVFRRQIRIAVQRRMPLVIHNRESDEDVIRILREEGAEEAGGVLHCFWGDRKTAEAALEMGFYLGVGGPVTFKNTNQLRAILADVPIDRLIVETDAPYLAPVPHRGRRNEPAYVVESVRALAELKGLSFEELADVTTKNARALFRFS